jgi:hypothetical protein
MLISGVIASTLLIGSMTLAMLIGLLLMPVERRREAERTHD